MLRFIYVITVNIFRIMYYAPKMSHFAKHPEKYSEQDRYALAQKLVKIVIRMSRVTTEYEGLENLPNSGGYIMFANHQGRYDPMGVLGGHDAPCTFLVDKRRADQFLVKQFVALLDAVAIDLTSTRSQINAIRTLVDDVKSGRRYIVFPEGFYSKHQGNRTSEFKQGCFLGAIHAKCAIVPVTLVDSYKVFGINSLKPIKTKVIFHKPILYEQYKGMKVADVSNLVKSVVDSELEKYEK